MIDSSRETTELSDAELILKVRDGCRDSETELYQRHKPRALAVAYRHTDTPSEAEDIVAESFFRVFDSLRRGLGPDEFFRAYLLTVVSREAFARNDAASKEFLTDEFSEFEAGARHSDDVLNRAEASFAINAFKSLAERWRAVLWYTEIEGMRPREIAPLLGVTPNAVATLALRAREALREAYLAAHLNENVNLASTCATTRKIMPAMIRGSASNRHQRSVTTHLRTCTGCSVVFEELNHVGLNLRAYALPLVLGGVTATGLPAAGGVEASGLTAADNPTQAAIDSGSPAAASASTVSAGSSIVGNSAVAVGVSIGAGLVIAAVAASAAGIIPAILGREAPSTETSTHAATPNFVTGENPISVPVKESASPSPENDPSSSAQMIDDSLLIEQPVRDLSAAWATESSAAQLPAAQPAAPSKTVSVPTPAVAPIEVQPNAASSSSAPTPDVITEWVPSTSLPSSSNPSSTPTSGSSPLPTTAPTNAPAPSQTATSPTAPTDNPTVEPTTPTAPTNAPPSEEEPPEDPSAAPVRISVQRVEGLRHTAYDVMLSSLSGDQRYEINFGFKHANVNWYEPSRNCKLTGSFSKAMSLSCRGDAVLRVNSLFEKIEQKIWFTMPSNPEFFEEFLLAN